MALRGIQWHSEAFRGTQVQSIALSGIQRRSVVISGNHSPAEGSSTAAPAWSNQEQSRVIKRQLEVLTCPGQLHSRSAEDHNDQSAWREHLLCQGAA